VHGVAAQSYKGNESEEADNYGGKIFFHMLKPNPDKPEQNPPRSHEGTNEYVNAFEV
jgi:hypothetical protein